MCCWMLYVFANSSRRQKEAIQAYPMMVEDGQSDEEVDPICSTGLGLEAYEGEDEDDLLKGDVHCEDPTTAVGHPPAHHVLTPEDIECLQSLASQFVDL